MISLRKVVVSIDQAFFALVLVLLGGGFLFAACSSKTIERGLRFMVLFVVCISGAFVVMGVFS